LAILKTIDRWFDVHDDEIGVFLWTAALLFLVRSSGVFLNNYAEMTFLKRYGVEYMPVVNMANAVATFLVMGLVTGLMTRLPGNRLLVRIFLFCGFSVALIRAIIPLGIDLIYPALFMLKAQYEVLLALLFWNLANDLFNTRQSKRLFPLITAGGVVGQILASFATPAVVRWLHVDNLLIVYLLTALSGAWVVKAMGRRHPAALFQRNADEDEATQTSILDEFKTILPLMRSSLLLKIMVALTFLPNILIPIMNYQFNYAIDQQFATESGLIAFLGYFRGVLNTVSLIILLFVGKLYKRFGLPVALMFHPFNYMLVFITFLLRFDAVAAVYARMSANIIRTTINIPAKAVVTGMFPDTYRAMVRPFLRGTVVRVGLILGSGLILFSEPLFHPRYLSLVAMPFAIAWAASVFVFKRRYANILLDLLEDDSVDVDAMDTDDLNRLLRDAPVQERLIRQFNAASGADRLLVGRLLRSIDAEALDGLLLDAIVDTQATDTRIELIELLSNRAGPAALKTFWRLADTDKARLATAMIEAGNRMSPATFASFNRYIYASSALPLDVKARAVGSLYRVYEKKYGAIIDAWLNAKDADMCRAGIIAAGTSCAQRFADRLASFLSPPADDDMTRIRALESLRAVEATGLNLQVRELLSHPTARMRRAALAVYQIEGDASLKQVIPMLGDEAGDVARLAQQKIRTADHQNSMPLIQSLAHPRKKVRDAVLALLTTMSIRDQEVYRYVQVQARTCYQLTLQALHVKALTGSDAQRLLSTHLEEQAQRILSTTLQVLSTQDPSGRMGRVVHGILSGSKRQRANGLEAMVQVLEKNVSRLLTPLLDDMDADERVAAGRRLFPGDMNEPSSATLVEGLLESDNWVTLTLALVLVREADDLDRPVTERIDSLGDHPNPHVSAAARGMLAQPAGRQDGRANAGKTARIPLIDKIVHLGKIDLFADLCIDELAAVAALTEVASTKKGETLFREGERGDALYVLLSGEVSVVKHCDSDEPVELDRVDSGEPVGEMAIFGDHLRSSTIQATAPAQLLTLHKRQFETIVREHPQVGLHACRVLSRRLRRLHAKISDLHC